MNPVRTLPRVMAPLVAVFAAAFALAAAGTAWGHHEFWSNCNYNAPTPSSVMYRDGSVTVALVARYEGYQWGGGCWNDNDIDQGWGDPPGDINTHGEGPDCSGFTFKVWRESTNKDDRGSYQWGRLRNVHGPYTAYAFKVGDGAPNETMSKTYASVMDALASTSHIGMIYARETTGADQIIEAKCEACGTNIFTRTYRGQTEYSGVRRIGWTG